MIEMQVADVAGIEERWEAMGKRIILRPGRDEYGRTKNYNKQGVFIRFNLYIYIYIYCGRRVK